EGQVGDVMAVTMSPDYYCILSSSVDHTIQVWNAQTTISTTVHRGCISCVSVSSDGVYLVSGPGGEAKDMGCRNRGPFKGHTGWKSSVVYRTGIASTGKRIASSSLSKTIRMWDIEIKDHTQLSQHSRTTTT
ncbi:hypothetical protein BV22DRAFT_1020707, partial [Leucogyrophana mollusca]